MLANTLLDDLDKELERRGLHFVPGTGTLRLVVNQEKCRVVASEEFEFLGFAFHKSRATINVAPKSIHRFQAPYPRDHRP